MFDDLFALITLLIGVSFAIMLVVLLIPVVRDRARPGHKAKFDHGNSLHDKRFTAIVSVTVFFVLDASVLVIATLIGIDIAPSLVKQRSETATKLLEGVPLVIVDDGELLRERMTKARVDVEDIMTAARKNHGLERLEQVKSAVLERNGGISIVPRQG